MFPNQLIYFLLTLLAFINQLFSFFNILLNNHTLLSYFFLHFFLLLIKCRLQPMDNIQQFLILFFILS